MGLHMTTATVVHDMEVPGFGTQICSIHSALDLSYRISSRLASFYGHVMVYLGFCRGTPEG